MKQLAVYCTDLHINKYTQFSEHIDRLQVCLKALDDAFKYAAVYKCNTILFGGDMGDLPKWIYIEVVDSICIRLAKWFKKYPNVTMVAISGNHDQNKKNYWEKPAKTLLNVFATAFPDRFILIDNGVYDVGNDCYVAGIPYYEHKSCFDNALNAQTELLQDKNDGSAVVTLLIHQTPEGIPNRHIKTDTTPTDPRYENFDLVLCGHIHQKQIITPKFIIGGNPYQRDLGDVGNEKGMWLIDLADPKDYEFISRKGRYPEFVIKQSDTITDEDRQTSFVIPAMDSKAIMVEGTADTTKFNNTLDAKTLLTNFWTQENGTDQKLLNIGLSLCE